MKYLNPFLLLLLIVHSCGDYEHSNPIDPEFTLPSPNNLQVQALGETEIELTWSGNGKLETGFLVERDGGSGFIQVAQVNANTSYYLDSDVNYGTDYMYRIAGHAGANQSEWTKSLIVNTTIPAPTSLSATVVSEGQVELRWVNNCVFASGFRIERDEGSGFVEIGTTSADLTDYTDTGLINDESYYYRVATYTINYASNYSAIAMANMAVVIDIDGNVYDTIQIGDQLWMSENLKVSHYRDGTPILSLEAAEAWTGALSGSYCYYDNNDSNFDTYGALYNWYATADTHNLAPEGWHLPTDDEWTELELALGLNQDEVDDVGIRGYDLGSKLAGRGDLWENASLEENTEFGTSGFMALPAGYRTYSGEFLYMGTRSFFWSATETSANHAWSRLLSFHYSAINRTAGNYGKGCALAIRCVKD